MGTRGAFGVRIGADVVDAIKQMKRDGFNAREAAERLRVVDGKTPPTSEQIEALKPCTELSVGKQTTTDWYCLTRKLQGDLYATLEAGIMIDSQAFLKDSLFCEYAYIVNFDDGVLEVYHGFQKEPHDRGRYAKGDPGEKYHGVALYKTFPLSEVESQKAEKLIGQFEKPEAVEA